MDQDDDKPTVVVGNVSRHGARPVSDGTLPWLEKVQDEGASRAGTAASRPAGAPPEPLQPGLLAARLRDEGEIAQGAMGSIHQVYDAALRRRVALKVLHARHAGNPQHARRFANEARITGALGHPNVVPVHELMTDGAGTTGYTMKLVGGRSLTELIHAQATRHDLELILRSLASVCDALACAHSRGVVHCDLKPDNIMVGEFGEVYVMDWGCAVVTGDRTLVDGPIDPEGSAVGTPSYMAPEQARGEVSRIDQRTDVFAVGAILYRVLTGRAPYRGSLQQALAAAQGCEFRAIDDSEGQAVKPPPMLAAIATKAMSVEPARRHQSAAELAEDLRNFLRGGNWYAMHVYPAGSFIVSEGDAADAAYIITAGRCEVRRRDPADPRRSLTLRVLEEGDVFGEIAVFADGPRSASVVALDEVSVVVVDRTSLEQLAAGTYLGKFVKALAMRFLGNEARS